MWRSTHRCNDLCKMLKLPPLTSEQRGMAVRPAHVVGGRVPRGGRDSDRELAERLQAEEYAKSVGADRAFGGGLLRMGGKGGWNAQRYDDTITNAMRFLAFQ